MRGIVVIFWAVIIILIYLSIKWEDEREMQNHLIEYQREKYMEMDRVMDRLNEEIETLKEDKSRRILPRIENNIRPLSNIGEMFPQKNRNFEDERNRMDRELKTNMEIDRLNREIQVLHDEINKLKNPEIHPFNRWDINH